MAKRTSRRKAPSRSRRKGGAGVSRLWWGAGIVALGAVLFDANRDALLPPSLRSERAESRPAARPAEPATRAAARAQPEARSPAVPRHAERGAPVPPAPVPAVRVAAVPSAPSPSPVPATHVRPAPAAAASAGGFVTARRAAVRTTPRSGAPVFVTLEKGRPLRVTAREGDWRRVEAGIFSGWVEAADLAADGTRRPEPARPTREASRPGPSPRASVPGG